MRRRAPFGRENCNISLRFDLFLRILQLTWKLYTADRACRIGFKVPERRCRHIDRTYSTRRYGYQKILQLRILTFRDRLCLKWLRKRACSRCRFGTRHSKALLFLREIVLAGRMLFLVLKLRRIIVRCKCVLTGNVDRLEHRFFL